MGNFDRARAVTAGLVLFEDFCATNLRRLLLVSCEDWAGPGGQTLRETTCKAFPGKEKKEKKRWYMGDGRPFSIGFRRVTSAHGFQGHVGIVF